MHTNAECRQKSEGRNPKAEGASPEFKVQGSEFKVQGSKLASLRSRFGGPPCGPRQPPVAGNASLSRFLCPGLVLAFLLTGCAGSRPLKGGKAVTTHSTGGAVQQTLVQGDNPSQASKQDQETVKVRTYTVPAGTRIVSDEWRGTGDAREVSGVTGKSQVSGVRCQVTGQSPTGSQGSTLNAQPSTAFVLSAPMPVTEREESRTRTELGAAQKDTAREMGAKLSSLKGIVWVGVGLFVFGLASLVYPPLKAVIGSVTTSAALALGGVALMVLPSLVVGNELLILGGVALAVGGWFLAHRHGQLNGQVQSLKAKG